MTKQHLIASLNVMLGLFTIAVGYIVYLWMVD